MVVMASPWEAVGAGTGSGAARRGRGGWAPGRGGGERGGGFGGGGGKVGRQEGGHGISLGGGRGGDGVRGCSAGAGPGPPDGPPATASMPGRGSMTSGARPARWGHAQSRPRSSGWRNRVRRARIARL